ncbi:TPA: glycosyltransferase family 2 protein [Vibrio metoecus]
MLNSLTLECYKSSDIGNISEVYRPKVSVIFPVYNVAEYVERSLVSLMEQTLDSFEVIIINDGSRDNSLFIIENVLARYPHRQGLIKLITRENRGVAKTRSEGMAHSNGDYVIHLDSDDWVELNWLEVMYYKALEDNADIVVCDYKSIFKNKAVKVHMPAENTGYKCLRQLLNDKQRGFTVNKLISRRVINKIGDVFNEGVNFLEDYIYIAKCFKASNTVSYVSLCLYNYNQCNVGSLTKARSDSKRNDALIAVDEVSKIVEYYDLIDDLMRYKIKIKSYLIYCEWSCVREETWRLYSEADSYVFRASIPLPIKIAILISNLKLYGLATIMIKSFFGFKFFVKKLLLRDGC